YMATSTSSKVPMPPPTAAPRPTGMPRRSSMLSLRLPICHRITGLPHLRPERPGRAAVVTLVARRDESVRVASGRRRAALRCLAGCVVPPSARRGTCPRHVFIAGSQGGATMTSRSRRALAVVSLLLALMFAGPHPALADLMIVGNDEKVVFDA